MVLAASRGGTKVLTPNRSVRAEVREDRQAAHVKTWPIGGGAVDVRARDGKLPEDPPGDRMIAALLILAAGGFGLMLVWLLEH
jgi:hypothetical protein